MRNERYPIYLSRYRGVKTYSQLKKCYTFSELYPKPQGGRVRPSPPAFRAGENRDVRPPKGARESESAVVHTARGRGERRDRELRKYFRFAISFFSCNPIDTARENVIADLALVSAVRSKARRGAGDNRDGVCAGHRAVQIYCTGPHIPSASAYMHMRHIHSVLVAPHIPYTVVAPHSSTA